MELHNEAALLEAILFLESEPVDLLNLSRISKLGKEVVLLCLDILKERYSNPSSGVELTEIGGGFALSPKAEAKVPRALYRGRQGIRRVHPHYHQSGG